MKKWILRIGVALVVLAIITVFIVAAFLGNIIKSGVETVGPKITQTDLKLSGVSLSLLGGSASVQGLVLGNPSGYKAPNAMEADEISVRIEPMSVLSDKVIVRSIRIDGSRIQVEGSPSDNNLTKIQKNVEAFVASLPGVGSKEGSAPASSGPGKKLQVDDLVLSNAKLSLTLSMLGGKTITAPLPEIHLSNLGQGPEGITPADLVKRLIGSITGSVTTVATDAIKNIGGAAVDTAKQAGKAAADTADKAAKGIKSLFKKN